MDYKSIRADARERLRGNWGVAVVAVLIYSLIATAVEGIGFIAGDFMSIIGSIVFIVIYGPLQYGLSYLFLRLNRKEKADVGDLFNGFSNNIGQKISTGVSIYIYTFLWSLLLIVPGIIASYSYSMTYYIMKDNPTINPNEAITKSKQMMKGHKMELFCLDLTFIGWILLSVLTLGIGLLWVIPYMQTARARFYEELVGPMPVEGMADGETAQETTIKSEEEVKPFQASSDANVVYNLKCETCGASETHTKKHSVCPYCGGAMKES